MKKGMARKMFEDALAIVGNQADWADINSAKTWWNLNEQTFLGEYCWVVFAAGFKETTLKKHFEDIEKVFKGFNPEAVARMRPVNREKLPIKNKVKADNFLKGAKIVHKEGWRGFKAHVKKNGMDALEELPGIGPIAKKHLAKNIGLADVAKDDVHLERCAKICSATVDELVSFLSEEYGMTKHKVDAVLWEFFRKRN